MADLLPLLVIVGLLGGLSVVAWSFVRFVYRKSFPLLATIIVGGLGLTGLLMVGAIFSALVMSGARMKAAPERPRSPCAIEGETCTNAERDAYLADLARRQLRDIPVLVGWRDELPWGEQTRITAVIASADRTAAQQVGEQTVGIGRRVRAILTGPDVEIEPDKEIVRDVTKLENVTFEWLVKPQHPGDAKLTLTIWNDLITPSGTVGVPKPAMERSIKVKIGFLDWLAWEMEQLKGLQWLIGGVLAVLGFLFTNRVKLRRWWRRRHPPAPPPAPAVPPGSPTVAPPPGPPQP
jgi:hypothetical protein